MRTYFSCSHGSPDNICLWINSKYNQSSTIYLTSFFVLLHVTTFVVVWCSLIRKRVMVEAFSTRILFMKVKAKNLKKLQCFLFPVLLFMLRFQLYISWEESMIEEEIYSDYQLVQNSMAVIPDVSFRWILWTLL